MENIKNQKEKQLVNVKYIEKKYIYIIYIFLFISFIIYL